jgi:signal transduction histidine kinase
MKPSGFDREWQLGELLDTAQLSRFGTALATLLGGDCAIADADGKPLFGEIGPGAQSHAIALELEAIAILYSTSADARQLAAAGELLHAVLRAQLRFRMASTLHLEAVAEDFESLKRKHAHLLESEARYRKLATELDARVKTQVAQLEERQQMLYEAEKLASVGQLAAGMAHEINNPLGFVRSNLASFQRYLTQFASLRERLTTDLAIWQALDLDFPLEDGGDLLRESEQGLERIAHIVADLKAFSNVDRASEAFADPNESIRQAAAVIETQLPAGINLKLDLLPLPSIVCLPGHLKQALFNILRNAVQAITDSGRPGTIKVSSEATTSGLGIRIQDTGVGMRPEQIEHAFEPFYTTRPVGHGVGLGLSTARSIVLAHSGTISLSSQPDAGTTVTITFPAPT